MPAYLKLGDIKGESTSRDHKDWIEILSFSWGISNPASPADGSGGGAGKVSFQDFHFTKRVDVASPLLMEAVCKGKVFPKVEFHAASQAGGRAGYYLKVELRDCLVSSLLEAGNSDDSPVDQIRLTFSGALTQVGSGGGVSLGQCQSEDPKGDGR